MNQDVVTHLITQAMTLTMKVSAPFLVAGLVVGLVISIFQAVTSIQEATLSFILKIIVTGVVLALGGPWMLDQMLTYTRDLFMQIPTLVGP